MTKPTLHHADVLSYAAASTGEPSECIGAMQAGWDHVDGVELEAEHVDIGRARLNYWAARGTQRGLFDEDTE